MSTKTLRKRIALVAVSAMGFGLLTTTAANAALDTATLSNADILWVSTTATTTGAAVRTDVASTSARSLGWVADSSTSAATSASGGLEIADGSAKTGVVLAGAQLALVAVNDTAAAGVSIVVTGGTLSSVTATDGASVTPSYQAMRKQQLPTHQQIVLYLQYLL